MLSIGALNNGIVLDHIEAGKAMEIYRYLDLDNLDCGIAIIKNAQSNKMERKDIIKIDGGLDLVDLDEMLYTARVSGIIMGGCGGKHGNIYHKKSLLF